MNALHSHAQFNQTASHQLGHTIDLGGDTEAGVFFVLLDNKHYFGERGSLT